MTKPIVIGLTGPTGAGKSTVCHFLEKSNYKIIDADKVAHKILKTNPDCKTKLIAEFGKSIVEPSGEIIRHELAKLAFSSKDKTRKLNEITHPFILEELKKLISDFKANSDTYAIILDVPLLFECHCDKLCDIIVSVVSNEEKRQARIVSRDSIGLSLASKIMLSQKSNNFYIENSDYILDNNSSIKELENETKKLFSHLKESCYET
ncbi:MAG: Dephospho-CoA kinase [Eubacteriales bacterium SKADARSKE-1]|nr:Dephospho-CoA kinase [Eubacteriales bacterium SKADARSKE-1]